MLVSKQNFEEDKYYTRSDVPSWHHEEGRAITEQTLSKVRFNCRWQYSFYRQRATNHSAQISDAERVS